MPAPLSVYGQTKLEGEQLVAAHCKKHLIFRTSWVYAARGSNFAKTMLRLAQEREVLSVIDDQFGAPTGAELLADITAHAIRQVAGGLEPRPQDCGLYYVAAAGQTSWHGYAKHILAQASQASQGSQAKKTLQIMAKEVRPVPASAYPTPARRPHNSRLNTARLQATFGLQPPTWQSGVNRMLEEGWA